jgi:hypothetical protein
MAPSLKVKIADFGEFLSSRPKGKKDLRSFAKGKRLKGKTIKIDFTDVFAVAPSWLDEFVNGLKKLGAKILFGDSDNESVKASLKVMKDEPKVHPWRLCPLGQYWVRTHPMFVPPTNKRAGYLTNRDQHCRTNPSGKDQLYPDEIHEIEKGNFAKVEKRPCAKTLKFANGAKFDDLIAGWTAYWNDVIGNNDSLDPNFVKALIASESGFEPGPSKKKTKDKFDARGLMQVTESTRKILGDERGELKDHFLTVTKDQLYDPSVNICAGVRWLFHKRKLLSSRKGREVTWPEVIEEYKGLRLARSPNKKQEIKDSFFKYLEVFSKCSAS